MIAATFPALVRPLMSWRMHARASEMVGVHLVCTSACACVCARVVEAGCTWPYRSIHNRYTNPGQTVYERTRYISFLSPFTRHRSLSLLGIYQRLFFTLLRYRAPTSGIGFAARRGRSECFRRRVPTVTVTASGFRRRSRNDRDILVKGRVGSAWKITGDVEIIREAISLITVSLRYGSG